MMKSSGVCGIGAEFLPLVTTAVLMVGCADSSPQDLVVAPVVTPVAPVDLHFDDGYIAVMFDAVLVDVWAGGQIDIGCPECAQQGLEITNEVIVTAETPITITATFHDAEGTMVNGLDGYQLTMTPVDAERLKFTRKSAFAGTLTRLADPATSVAGQATLDVGLYNVGTMTFDFGPFPVPVTLK
jgi:hypothetical protein